MGFKFPQMQIVTFVGNRKHGSGKEIEGWKNKRQKQKPKTTAVWSLAINHWLPLQVWASWFIRSIVSFILGYIEKLDCIIWSYKQWVCLMLTIEWKVTLIYNWLCSGLLGSLNVLQLKHFYHLFVKCQLISIVYHLCISCYYNLLALWCLRT